MEKNPGMQRRTPNAAHTIVVQKPSEEIGRSRYHDQGDLQIPLAVSSDEVPRSPVNPGPSKVVEYKKDGYVF
jgi:hypothetical protein